MKRNQYDETIDKCPECRSKRILFDTNTGEVVCADCGYVIVSMMVDLGPEWRSFEQEKDGGRCRVGAPVTMVMHDMGLSTKIGWKVVGESEIGDFQVDSLSKIRQWERKTYAPSGTLRNLSRGLSEIAFICSNLGLPNNVMETASSIYRKVAKGKVMRGRSIRVMAAAAVYLACKKCGIPRMLKEIASSLNINKKSMARCYRFLINSLNIASPSTDLKLYVSRFVNNLNLRGEVEKLAMEILECVKFCGIIDGKGPMGLAAASTYLVSILLGYRLTQREVAEVTKVTEVTLRNRYKELLRNVNIYAILDFE